MATKKSTTRGTVMAANQAALQANEQAKKSVEAGPNVSYTRPEVSALMSKWTMVEDCLQGQEQIKKKGTTYLPKPNADDESNENAKRYAAYLLRAVFYNVTKRTLDGLVGQVFCRDPITTIPERMVDLRDNVDGDGVSLDQQAKKGLGLNISYGRFGLLVDYPVTSAPASLADQQAGFIRPTIVQYDHKSIINWRQKKVGAKQVLTLIVLAEQGEASNDGFEISTRNEWRVLELTDAGAYQITVYKQDEDTNNFVVIDGPHIPKDASGKELDHIPFFFCGVVNNDPVPDEPMMVDLAVLNIAHYRNSADYEDSCYTVGNPTPFFSGLTEQWVKNVFKSQPINLGSRAAIPLPTGGTAGLLQVSPNSMPKEAMEHKEKQMMALGAKLIESGPGQSTLGQAQIDETSETSMLATAAINVSLVYTLALKEAAKFYGVEDTNIEYSLNTDFPAARLTPNERAQLILEWQAGAIAETEMRAGLRKAGVATLDTKDFKEEVAKNPSPQQVAMTNNLGKGGGDNKPPADPTAQNNGGNQAGN